AHLLAVAESLAHEGGSLEAVVPLSALGMPDAPRAAAGASSPRADAGPSGAAPDRLPNVGPSDVATIVYTSGTTGEPKGAVLTHANIVSNVRALIRRYGITPDDSALSYLPLAHMFERTCGHYVFLFAGGTVAYAQGLATVADDIRLVRPTVLIAVPRVLERAYEVALAKVEGGPGAGRGVVRRAFALLNERANRRYRGERLPPWLALRCGVYDALVASKFRKVAGGRLRLIVSGGAPLDRRIGKILHVLGLTIVEGYGLTETSPVVCCGEAGAHRLGTVGRPLQGVEVRIAADGEILVRGPNVMKGYLGKPEETSRALDPDGWFHTGDLGEFDDRGNLIVTGRSKEIIVTSYGKNVAPAPIEQRLARSPYVSQAVVFGDSRKSIVALIVPDRAALARFAEERGIAAEPYEALLAHPQIRAIIGEEVLTANAEAAPYERVVAFELLARPFSEGDGTLTPTLKVRRKAVERTCTDLIQALYDRLEGRHAH
ncbi:MAG: AMP-binding protein, partial [Candidatus Eisenbacteria bacterium]|nr:AMP-binding protein [Candidatus Eisenbacteria bacterium]